MPRAPIVLSILVASFAASTARADTSSSKAVAEALFRDGTQLMNAGDLQAACPKFEDSMKLDPALGTLLYLAACHEKEGRTASAWSEFSSARAWAERTEQHDRAAFAQKRIAALESRLSNVVITAPAIPGLQLKLDEGTLSSAALGTPLPVDPGDHTVAAEAPERQPWHILVKIPAEPGNTAVEIPPLAPAPVVAATPPAPGATGSGAASSPDATAAGGSGNRIGLWTGVGVTAVGVGIGTWFGILTLQERDDAQKACPNNKCVPGGLDHISRAKTDSVVSTVAFSVGAAAAIVAGYFLFKKSGPSTPATASVALTSLGVAPAVAPRVAGLTVVGTFD
jgi:hypothetical protein